MTSLTSFFGPPENQSSTVFWTFLFCLSSMMLESLDMSASTLFFLLVFISFTFFFVYLTLISGSSSGTSSSSSPALSHSSRILSISDSILLSISLQTSLDSFHLPLHLQYRNLQHHHPSMNLKHQSLEEV